MFLRNVGTYQKVHMADTDASVWKYGIWKWLKSHWVDRLNSHFLRLPSTRSRDVSADRTARQYWGLPEMSLLTGPPDSTGGCQSALVDKLGVNPNQCHHPWSTSQITRG
jgi:hypothetical protein